MGLLDRIFGRSKKTEVAEAPAPTRCPHTILNAVWDSADDVGNEGEGVVVHLPGLRRELLARRGCGATRR